MKYRSEVDGLRTLAVVPVILFHAGVPFLPGGFVGVDVFFVISGFLITRIIADEIHAGTFSFARFYERRARRILPALAVVLLVSSCVAMILMTPQELDFFAKSVGATALFANNMFLLQHTDYFSISSEFLPLLHTWSLSVEEQYYIVMPVLALLLPWLGVRRFVLLLCVLGILSLGTSLFLLDHGYRGEAFYLMPTRAWELLAGAVAALVPGARARQGAALLGIAMIVVPIATFSKDTPAPGLPTILPVLGTALVLRYAQAGTLVARTLSWRPFVVVGLMSYSAYLWHQPLFAFARLRLGNPDAQVMAGLVVLTFGLAWASWMFVEGPTRRARGPIWGNTGRVLVASAASIAAFVAFAVAGWRTDGFAAQRLNPEQQALMQGIERSPLRERCHAGGGAQAARESCTIGAGPATWAVLGDSHGAELSYALAQGLERAGQGVEQFTSSACAPKFNADYWQDGCSDWTQEAVHQIIANPDIRYVVLSYRMNLYLLGEPFRPGTPAATPDEQGRIWQSYTEEIRALRAAGKQVVVVLPVPLLPAHVEQMIFRDPEDGQTIAGVSRAWWGQRMGFLNTRLPMLTGKVTFVDPARDFCDQQTCYAVRNGEALYFDTNHPSLIGARLIAAQVLDRVLGFGRWQMADHGERMDVTGGSNL